MRSHKLKHWRILFIFAQAVAFSADASQSSMAGMVDLLTCNIRMTERQAIALLQSDGFREAGAAEHGFELVKPVQSEGICIKHAKVVGAFGVLMVVGQICDVQYAALKGAFEKQFPESPGTALEPGKLYLGKSPSGEGMIYRGTANMPPKPLESAREVAFLCARRMGDTR